MTVKREQEGSPPRSAVKRSRRPPEGPSNSIAKTVQDEEPNAATPHPYERLKHVPLPAAIVALPHVMKFLDSLLMTLEEALLEAAALGHKHRVYQLLDNLEWDISLQVASDALVAAATGGHLATVEVLVEDFCYAEESRFNIRESIQRAAVAAAANNQLNVVEWLAPLVVDPDWDAVRAPIVGRAMMPIFLAAATNGSVDVVNFVAESAKEKGYVESLVVGGALASAIRDQHDEMVEHLLNLEEFKWTFGGSCEEAIKLGKRALVERFYEQYARDNEGGNLLVEMARIGKMETVKYLMDIGYNDPGLIGDALVVAVANQPPESLQVLIDTGRLSSDAFDKAFEAASASIRYCNENTVFLYGKKRPSPHTVARVFETTGSFPLLKMLYDNEDITTKSVITAFKRRAQFYGQAEIITFLYKQGRIPSDVISEVFEGATKRYPNAAVVHCLHKDPAISTGALDAAFLAVAAARDRDLMRSLYNEERMPPEFLYEPLMKAARMENFTTVKFIVALLAREPASREFLYKALVAASHLGDRDSSRTLLKSYSEDWPTRVLKEAHRVAKTDSIKNLIRDTVCNQVFRAIPDN